MMKLLKVLFLFVCISGWAQSKVGTIDVDFILGQMPELTQVQTDVEAYRKKLDNDLQARLQKIQSEVDKYKKEEAGMTINQRKVMQDSILKMEGEAQQFNQNGNQLMVLKQEELLAPLYDKIGLAMEKVAQAQQYTQVLLRNQNVVYIDNNYDITLAVLKELGIELKEEK